MNAIEFETDASNGVIHIPARHRNLFSKHLKVILLSEIRKEKQADVQYGKRSLPSLFYKPIKVEKIEKFNREEIYNG
ncbi:MAG: hypothetical protein WCP55_06315 [Lentisphaerota bacterium]